jgi:hypothetical protein
MANLQAVADRLFVSTMSPLVLGGAVRPGHAIGARQTLALGDRVPTVDAELVSRVAEARVRRGRSLAPVDSLPGPGAADWMLAAALHDILQAANPTFDRALRRGAAVRILESAAMALSRIRDPLDVREALARHSWFARTLDVARTDTRVSWWTGSGTFRGVEPPARLQLWQGLRRVRVSRSRHSVLELESLAVDRARLTEVVGVFLSHSPLTDLSTCTRLEPRFVWRPAALALLATSAGRTLGSRALDRLPTSDADAALGQAARELLRSPSRALATPALALLGERAAARALAHALDSASTSPVPSPSAALARALGALSFCRTLDRSSWRVQDLERIDAWVEAELAAPEAIEARDLMA